MADKRAVILVRRSLDDEEAGESLGRQERNAAAFCDSAGLTVVRTFTELGSAFSRSLDDREEFKAAVGMLKADQAGTLVVERCDRLTRAGSGVLMSLVDELAALGKRIYACDIGSYLDEPSSRLVVSILGELALSESRSLSNRLKASVKDRRSRGLWLGGTPPDFYETHEGKLRLSDRAAARKIVDRLLDDAPWAVVAREVGWGKSKLKRWAVNPILAGYASVDKQPLMDGDEFVSGITDEPLITPGERQYLLDRQTKGKPGRPTSALLSGGIVYTDDGRKATADNGYYRARPEGDLPGFGVNVEKLDQFVTDEVQFFVGMLDDNYPGEEADFLEGLAALFEAPQPDLVERRALTDELAELTARVDQLETAYWVDNSLPQESYERLVPKLRERVDATKKRLSAIPAAQVSTWFIRGAVLTWDDWRIEAKRAFIRYCVECVVIKPGSRAAPMSERATIIWKWHPALSEASGAP